MLSPPRTRMVASWLPTCHRYTDKTLERTHRDKERRQEGNSGQNAVTHAGEQRAAGEVARGGGRSSQPPCSCTSRARRRRRPACACTDNPSGGKKPPAVVPASLQSVGPGVEAIDAASGGRVRRDVAPSWWGTCYPPAPRSALYHEREFKFMSHAYLGPSW